MPTYAIEYTVIIVPLGTLPDTLELVDVRLSVCIEQIPRAQEVLRISQFRFFLQ